MIQFGTGGWRAIIGDEFTKANIQLLAKAMAEKMKREGVEKEGIVIGYDRRFLAKEAMQWLAQVFAEEGIPSYLIYRSVPTPLVMYYVMKHQLHYGMMVTASHNPAIYNGVKVFTYGGRDAEEGQTKEIEKEARSLVENHVEIVDMEYEKGKQCGKIIEIFPLNEYLDSIMERIDLTSIKERGLRVAFDPMYGVSETALNMLLHTGRCYVKTIHERHDTLFGGKLPSPSATTLKSLQNTVLEGGYDIGIATDGDADRIGIIDDKGNFLHTNETFAILYYYLIKYKGWEGDVVRNIATTHRLDRIAEHFKQKCYEVPVGFKHISAKMSKVNAIIGGESSGGLTVKGHIHGKDGIYAAMLLVEMLAVTGKKLSTIREELDKMFGSSYMEERDYTFSKEKKKELFEKLMVQKTLPKLPYKIEKVSYEDGCKLYLKGGGWVICRFSGTEPVLRIFCEMPTKEEARGICDKYEETLGL